MLRTNFLSIAVISLGALVCLLFTVTPLGDGVQLLYTSKDDWGGFLRPENSAKGVGHLKAADLKLLKFAHNELLKEKEDQIKADSQGLAALKAREARKAAAHVAHVPASATRAAPSSHASRSYTDGWDGYLPSMGKKRASAKSDDKLLRIAESEQRQEERKGELTRRKDLALESREAALARAKKAAAVQAHAAPRRRAAKAAVAPDARAATAAALHGYTQAWGGYLPALGHKSVSAAAVKASRDMRLLRSAEKELQGERKREAAVRRRDEIAARLRRQREQAKRLAEGQAREIARSGKAGVAQRRAKVAARKEAAADQRAAMAHYTKSWGGWLPAIKHRSPESKTDEELKLFKLAQADQDHDQKAGEENARRDTAALLAKEKAGAARAGGGAVRAAYRAELGRIERLASVGLQSATEADREEERHAWGHLPPQAE